MPLFSINDNLIKNNVSTVNFMNKLEHDREECIGCGACVAIHPEGWEMAEDGKSDINNSTLREDGWEEKTVDDADFELHKEAAESCPVNCIHLTKDEKKVV